jgi:hypothetical protein
MPGFSKNYNIFRLAEIFKKYFSPGNYFVKENKSSFGIFWEYSSC